jgi:subtilase family serine protease
VKEDTQIHAVVRNTGKSDAPAVKVAFFVNGAAHGTVTVDVPAGGSATASIGWNTMHLRGDYVVRVDVDPDNAVPELNESDNSASKLFTVRGNRVR